jgi:fumarylacetoacetase
MEALEPFRCCPSAGPSQTDPIPLPYLIDENYHLGAYDLKLQVSLCPSGEDDSIVIAESNAKYLYWNVKQQVAHHSVTGCVMRPGDLLGTGTISGQAATAKGCLLEMTRDGTEDIELNFLKKLRSNLLRLFIDDISKTEMSLQ